MYELKVSVGKVLGTCTAEPPMKRADHFFVRDGDITIPDGGYICLWAFQSLLPLITPKEREICEHKDDDWMWRVHHVQCPDPKGRVVFKIERVGRIDRAALEEERATKANGNGHGSGDADSPGLPRKGSANLDEAPTSAFARRTSPAASADELRRDEALLARVPAPGPATSPTELRRDRGVRDLRVVVEQVKGKCTSRMQPGDCFLLREGRLYIPAGRHFCLYALHAALPLLPAKQRSPQNGDWMADDHRVICPDPAGNVVMRIEEDAPGK